MLFPKKRGSIEPVRTIGSALLWLKAGTMVMKTNTIFIRNDLYFAIVGM
jgi:hypothetical protein